MNPLLAGLINIIPGVVNSVGHLIKDKKEATVETTKILPAFVKDVHNIADGIELSSKTVIGYGLGGVVITYALSQDLSQKHNLIILGVGALMVISTTIAKALEK